MGYVKLYDNVDEAFGRISIVCKGLEGPLSEMTKEEFAGLCYSLSDIRVLLKEGLEAADGQKLRVA